MPNLLLLFVLFFCFSPAKLLSLDSVKSLHVSWGENFDSSLFQKDSATSESASLETSVIGGSDFPTTEN